MPLNLRWWRQPEKAPKGALISGKAKVKHENNLKGY